MMGSNSPQGGPDASELSRLMGIMQGDDGIAKLLQEPTHDNGNVSTADIIADVINVQRLDNKRLAEAAGVDVEAHRLTPEMAAHLVQDLVKGDSLELIQVFNELEDQREEILEAMEDEEAVLQHREVKQSVLYHTAGDDETDDE